MIDKIIQTKNKCTGCSACFNICSKGAIDIQLVDGFYKPVINKDICVSCGKCIDVCPQNSEQKESLFGSIVFACKNKDNTTRIKSSSGGIFSLIAEEILKKNGTVYGAAFDNHFYVHHVCIESINELDKIRRSKYLQSYLGNTFCKIKDDLESDRYVLFSGTPCQCAGLRNFLKNHNNKDKLYIVEVLCHGVPSPKVWNNYIKYRMKKAKTLNYPTSICFKSKNCSHKANWGNSYMHMEFEDSVYCMDNMYDPFMMLFARANIILNESCYTCKYRSTINRSYCDITLGDFWGIEKFSQSFADDKGVSLVICHSANGKQLLLSLENYMDMLKVDPNLALRDNGAFVTPEIYKRDIKIKNQLCKNANDFGKIYIKHLPVIYKRKLLGKVRKLVKILAYEHKR